MINVISIGDIMGKAGRRCIAKLLPIAIERFQADIVIANGENAAGGFGITKKIFDQLTSQGIDCITTGNHWHDKREIYKFLPQQPNLIIPANMMNVSEINDGWTILETKTCGSSYAVVNLIGKAFMHQDNRNPFYIADEIFKRIPDSVRIRIVDVHAEATSEKQGLGRYMSGKASLVYGTHSHVPTADERILNDFTGYITDLGMTGAYDSVIGINTKAAIERMTSGEKKNFKPATEDPWMCFITASICPKTGRCVAIERHRWELDAFELN